MLVAAAVCPCPPLLVPEVAAGAAPELDAARAACTDALGVLAAARPDLLVVVGPAERPGAARTRRARRGSFRGFGVDLDVRLGPRTRGGTRRPDARCRPRWPSAPGCWSAPAGRPRPVEGLGRGRAARSRAVRRRRAGARRRGRSGSRCW